MLYIPGTDEKVDAQIEGLLSRSTVEHTPDGFEYFVAHPEEQMGLSAGRVFRTAEESILTIVVNGNVEPDDRSKIVSAAVAGESHLHEENYWLANAIREVVGWQSDEEFTENISAINLMINALRYQSANIQNDPRLDTETKRRLRSEARSALGMLATLTGITTEASEFYGEFNKQGLWIPHVGIDEVEISGFMNTKRGSVKGSFKSMQERSERHSCASCSSQIIKDTRRITLGLDNNDGYSDHHHYHYPCFIERVLPKFDLQSLEQAPLKLG